MEGGSGAPCSQNQVGALTGTTGRWTWRFSSEKIPLGSPMLSGLCLQLCSVHQEKPRDTEQRSSDPRCSQLITLVLPLVAVTDAAAGARSPQHL